MKISVIIPLYNKGKHIQRAIDSVLAQTVPFHELIVIDDGSTDDGPLYVMEYANSSILLVRQENAGVSAARNKGIEKATGEMVAFLDADDAYAPDFLETIIRIRTNFPECGAYATSYSLKRGESNSVGPFYGIPVGVWEGIVPHYFKSVAIGEPIIFSSAVAIPKTVFQVCGTFAVGEKMGEDQECWLRIALVYPVAFSSHIGSFYYLDAENRATNRNLACGGYKLVTTAFDAIKCGLLSDSDVFYLREFANRHLLISAWHCVLSGQPRKARHYLRQCKTELYRGRKFWCMAWACIPSVIALKIKEYVQRRRRRFQCER